PGPAGNEQPPGRSWTPPCDMVQGVQADCKVVSTNPVVIHEPDLPPHFGERGLGPLKNPRAAHACERGARGGTRGTSLTALLSYTMSLSRLAGRAPARVRRAFAMTVWDWVEEFQKQALERGDADRARLPLYHVHAYRYRETDPDHAMSLFEEGGRLARHL